MRTKILIASGIAMAIAVLSIFANTADNKKSVTQKEISYQDSQGNSLLAHTITRKVGLAVLPELQDISEEEEQLSDVAHTVTREIGKGALPKGS